LLLIEHGIKTLFLPEIRSTLNRLNYIIGFLMLLLLYYLLIRPKDI